MNLLKTITLATFAVASLGFAHAADLTGKWAAEFDSQIGTQKYAYEFKVEGGQITGKATYENQRGKGETNLKDVKLDKDVLTFVENMDLNGMSVPINYAGKVSGDEIKLTRTVGSFGSEQLVAKRLKASEAKPAAAK